jgi:isocitrate lyase
MGGKVLVPTREAVAKLILTDTQLLSTSSKDALLTSALSKRLLIRQFV